ncbi:MAG: hypothetical protein A3E87_01690 [Gammaproteobacteria bacterium RIFCSPHIGHO2_12_FULL_35_23]|nr:MAG: hypothetical protein A3E87_01690 [Gammaproteobacteria bacterium RIFCSPHIGHO2_12_FULL_35_23]
MSFLKCKACAGNKKVKGMGYIEKNCKVCDGKGYLSEEKSEESKKKDELPIIEQVENAPKAKRKYVKIKGKK